MIKIDLEPSDDRLIVLGCSDFINNIKGSIPSLIKGHRTLGLNRFSDYFTTTYRLWMDNPHYGNAVYREYCGSYKPYLVYEPNFDKRFDLFGSHTVASFAVDFAAKMGFKEVVLFGVLDGTYRSAGYGDEYEFTHFYDDIIMLMHKDVIKSWKNSILMSDVARNRIKVSIPYYSLNSII